MPAVRQAGFTAFDLASCTEACHSPVLQVSGGLLAGDSPGKLPEWIRIPLAHIDQVQRVEERWKLGLALAAF
jgi:hypothetical protein